METKVFGLDHILLLHVVINLRIVYKMSLKIKVIINDQMGECG